MRLMIPNPAKALAHTESGKTPEASSFVLSFFHQRFTLIWYHAE
jgi:hypothetical protein